MTIITKYSNGDLIFFIYNCEIYQQKIMKVQTITAKNTGSDTETVDVTYLTEMNDHPWVWVPELHAFDSKEELIKTITERFHKSIATKE